MFQIPKQSWNRPIEVNLWLATVFLTNKIIIIFKFFQKFNSDPHFEFMIWDTRDFAHLNQYQAAREFTKVSMYCICGGKMFICSNVDG